VKGGEDSQDAYFDPNDPCYPISTASGPVPLVDGSAPECPRCSVFSRRAWNPVCHQEGLQCDYLELPNARLRLGASCTCVLAPPDAGAAPSAPGDANASSSESATHVDAGPLLVFQCGI
jgi:hypothetical protein